MMATLFKEYAPLFTMLGAAVMFIYLTPKILAKLRGSRVQHRAFGNPDRKLERIYRPGSSSLEGTHPTKHPQWGQLVEKIVAWRTLPLVLGVLLLTPLALNLLLSFDSQSQRKAMAIISLPLALAALFVLKRAFCSIQLFERALRIKGLFQHQDLVYDDVQYISLIKYAPPLFFAQFFSAARARIFGSQWQDDYAVIGLHGQKKLYLSASLYKELFPKLRQLKQHWPELDSARPKALGLDDP